MVVEPADQPILAVDLNAPLPKPAEQVGAEFGGHERGRLVVAARGEAVNIVVGLLTAAVIVLLFSGDANWFFAGQQG